MTRSTVYWGLYWGPPYYGSYHMWDITARKGTLQLGEGFNMTPSEEVPPVRWTWYVNSLDRQIL